MSDTPKTDALQDELLNCDTYTAWIEMSKNARTLESELAEKTAQVTALREALRQIEGGHYKTTNLITGRLVCAANNPTALAELRDEMIAELQAIARAVLDATKGAE